MDKEKLKQKIIDCNFRLLFNAKGYKYFSNGEYNLNIIGIRNIVEGNVQDNTFNDFICVSYKESNHLTKYVWECTTDPGVKALKQPINAKGCAILVPGQYQGAYKIGKHKGQYDALVQAAPVKVYRDGNQNDILDFDSKTIDEGYFGINIHRSNPYTESTIVDMWSCGCQTFKKAADFEMFMTLCKKAAEKYGNSFTYTLITSDDLKLV